MKKLTKKVIKMSVSGLLILASIITSGVSTKAAVYGKGITEDSQYQIATGLSIASGEDGLKEQVGFLTDYKVQDSSNMSGSGSGKPILKAYGVSTSINWKIPNNDTFATLGFNLKVGDKVAVGIIVDPADKEVQMGVVHSSGIVYYVKGKGHIVHTFGITKAGRYQVFVTNRTGKKISAIGMYNY